MDDYAKLDAPEITSLLFHPRSVARTALPENAQDIDIEVAGAVLGCRFHHADKDAATIIFFHGNGETVADYDDIASRYTANGMNILITSYRGYGWSTGSATATTMMNDAFVIFEKASQWLKDNRYEELFFLMGRSLGSAPALALAAKEQENLKGIIIESGFAETLPLAELFGVDISGHDIEESECFKNCEHIAKVTIATLILHGAKDTLIPARMAERLQANSGARGKQFLMVPGAGHNTMIEVAGEQYFTVIKTFVDKACGRVVWQYKKHRRNRKTP